MKTSTLYHFVFATLISSLHSSLASAQELGANVTNTIVSAAKADGINFSVLNFTGTALTEIASIYVNADVTDPAKKRSMGRFASKETRDVPFRIDVHSHIVPDWFQSLNPTTGGNPTPAWNVTSHLAFMASESISRSIVAFSAPGANVYKGNKLATVALARLINEYSAALARAYPDQFSFYAVVPLPYTSEAISEAKYALDTLGAVGIVLYSNYEAMYLGNAAFAPFFKALNDRGGRQIVYVHPATPYVKVNGQFIEANPTPYPTGNIEFYFETARTFEDLTLSQTIQTYANIHYVIPHVGGSFPSVIDRLLKSVPAIDASSRVIYNSRFWYDSAGPTYYHQVSGLLAYGIPASQLLFGTDYPYAPVFTQPGSLAAIQASTAITDTQKQALFVANPKALFDSKIKW